MNQERQHTSPAKILVVEDELIVAKNLTRSLEKQGYHVTGVASSGKLAIEKARETQPNLVLMDITLQGDLDGIETAEIISSQLHIPIIYMTAHADDSTLDRAKRTGPYGYLVKPFKPQDTKTTIEMALAKHSADQQRETILLEEKELNTLKTRFLSMAAHDLRTPLTAIAGSAELLNLYSQKGDFKQKGEKCFHRIQTSVDCMNQMLEDLSILGESQLAQLPFNPVSVDIVAFCQDLVNEFQTISQAQIIFIEDRKNIQGQMDIQGLRHILMNLLSNAIKYSPDEDTIEFTLTSENKTAIFVIKDQGIGIPQEDLERLFEPFCRAKNVGKVKGSGLGLAIVKQFVDLHKGTIKVESQIGQGTTLTLTMPLIASS
ncbi:MAG: ATP-binding protein [Spirulinaceae cyanobacterium]